MQEHNVPQPEINNTSPEREEAEKNLIEIRRAIDTHTASIPLEGPASEKALADFGLEQGDYTVFKDDHNKFINGLFRFVPSDPDAKPLDGIAFANQGGPMHDLNRRLKYTLISANGDVSSKEIVENSKGITRSEFEISTPHSDEEVQRYKRFTEVFLYEIAEIIKPRAVESENRAPEVDQIQDSSIRFGSKILNLLKIGNSGRK